MSQTDIQDIRSGYKILTHDWRPPIQDGKPLCDGKTFPLLLPPVELDTGPDDCAKGYNYADSLCEAAKIASFWPTGRPAKCLVVSASEDAIQRQSKRRCSQLTLERLCNQTEIRLAMQNLVKDWAGEHTSALTEEQWLWYEALGRPFRDKDKVMFSLQKALDVRGLNWSLKEITDASAAWDARAWDARAWDARDAWATRAAWAARATRTWATRDAWATRTWATRTWAARDAWSALNMNVAVSVCGLKGYTEDYLTIGIRDAYLNGLEIAFPTGETDLGWIMCEQQGDMP